jgi:hypothetical protein
MRTTPSVQISASDKAMNPRVFWPLLILMVGFAVFVRFYDLKSDPPILSVFGSQDLTTDGAYLTVYAKQAVQYGQWDLFGYKDWTPLRVSIVSGVSYLLFKFLGVSRAVANAAGSLLSLGGILLFLFALWDDRRRKFILLFLLLLCSNTMLAIYGRVPLSENGLLFLAGLTFLVYSRWFDTIGGKVTVGVLVALCGLLGKSFGFLLGVGPLLFIILSGGTSRIRDALLLIVPGLVTFGLFWVAFYHNQGLTNFLWERSTGVHGFPHGFESPKGFIEALISYGRSGLHSDSVVVSLVFALALLWLLLGKKGKIPVEKTTVFMLGWIGSWILVLSPFNYLPVRYFLILIIPMSAVAASFLERLDGAEIGGMGKLIWWRIGGLVLAAWLIADCIGSPFLPHDKLEDAFQAVWIVLPIGLLLAVVLTLVLRSRKFVFNKAAASLIVIAVIGFTAATEGYKFVRWYRGTVYLLDYAANDVKSLVGVDAVLAGTYGPALAYDSELRSVPQFETDDWGVVCATFRACPVTHLVCPELAWNNLLGLHPELQKARVITRLWMRDVAVVLARVSGVFGNRTAGAYQLTDFEKLDMGILHLNLDTVDFYLKRFGAAHPFSRAGLAHLYYLTQGGQPLGAARSCVETMAEHYPTDYAVCELAAIYYKALYEISQDPKDMARSQEFLERAIRCWPLNEEYIRRNYATYPIRNRLL